MQMNCLEDFVLTACRTTHGIVDKDAHNGAIDHGHQRLHHDEPHEGRFVPTQGRGPEAVDQHTERRDAAESMRMPLKP